MDALEHEVSAGHQVIVSVDGPKIWNALGVPDGVFDPNTQDHAVTVTGIDTTNNIVHLNDTGHPNGADEAVPLSVFEQAWQLSGHAMVATTDPDHPQTHADPLAVPGPIPPATEHDPFAAPTDHPLITTAMLAGGVGVAAVGAAALGSKEARAAAMANTAAMINRARAAAAAHTDAAVNRTRGWIEQRKAGPGAEHQASPAPE
jgi:hypothetical protein